MTSHLLKLLVYITLYVTIINSSVKTHAVINARASRGRKGIGCTCINISCSHNSVGFTYLENTGTFEGHVAEHVCQVLTPGQENDLKPCHQGQYQHKTGFHLAGLHPQKSNNITGLLSINNFDTTDK